MTSKISLLYIGLDIVHFKHMMSAKFSQVLSISFDGYESKFELNLTKAQIARNGFKRKKNEIYLTINTPVLCDIDDSFLVFVDHVKIGRFYLNRGSKILRLNVSKFIKIELHMGAQIAKMSRKIHSPKFSSIGDILELVKNTSRNSLAFVRMKEFEKSKRIFCKILKERYTPSWVTKMNKFLKEFMKIDPILPQIVGKWKISDLLNYVENELTLDQIVKLGRFIHNNQSKVETKQWIYKNYKMYKSITENVEKNIYDNVGPIEFRTSEERWAEKSATFKILFTMVVKSTLCAHGIKFCAEELQKTFKMKNHDPNFDILKNMTWRENIVILNTLCVRGKGLLSVYSGGTKFTYTFPFNRFLRFFLTIEHQIIKITPREAVDHMLNETGINEMKFILTMLVLVHKYRPPIFKKRIGNLMKKKKFMDIVNGENFTISHKMCDKIELIFEDMLAVKPDKIYKE